MVVNRRISVSAVPPVSRTASTQPVTRVATPSIPPIPGVSNQTNRPKTKKRRSDGTKPKIKKSISFPGPFRLLLFALSAFLVYITAICRTDFPRTITLCKSFDLYRTQMIDSYVLPPVEYFFRHAESYVSPLKPYTASTADFTRTRITPHVSAFIDSSLSYYHAEISPWLHWLVVDQLWNGVIKPSYFDIFHRTLERHTRFFYNDYLAPGARKGSVYAQATYDRLLPHAQHYLSNAQTNAAKMYATVRLHVLDFYRRICPHVVVLSDWVHIQARSLAQKADDLRREFIDPHVRKILDKVGENRDSSSDDFSTDSLTDTPVDSPSDNRPHRLPEL